MFAVTFLKIASILLAIVGALFAIPLSVAFVYGESSVYLPLIVPMVISFLLVFAVNIPTRKIKITMNTRQTFVIVALSWIIVSFMGTVPLYFSGTFTNFADALFESES